MDEAVKYSNLSIDKAAAALADLTKEAARNLSVGVANASALVRVEVPIAPVDPLEWLRRQAGTVKTFWLDRDGAFQAAGLGVADEVAGATLDGLPGALEEICGGLSPKYPRLRYYGGACFCEPAAETGRWRSMSAFRFVLPRFEMVQTKSQTYLACNLVGNEDLDLDEVLRQLESLDLSGEARACRLAPPVSREDRPDHEGWLAMGDRAMAQLASGDVAKIVLARESLFTFSSNIEAMTLLDLLAHRAVRSYDFCFQTGPHEAFLGCSPERLYRRQGGRVYSEALAGTRPRGASSQADDALCEELAHSEKDRREHAYVIDAIEEALAKLCTAVHRDETVSNLKLRDCQHLYCRIEGTLADDHSDASLLAALHPTPAVGGVPTGAAMGRIAELEPFSRGWYAGPVGWLAHDAAEFAVAIRSGLVTGRELSLYSGAGFVDGSTPQGEWDEIENKMSTFLGVLMEDGRED